MKKSVPQPPTRPWKKGFNPEYSAIVLEVEVCQDKNGNVFSSHRPQDSEDRTTLLSWSTGGLEQSAFALLVEALRKETLLSLLVAITKEPELLQRLSALPDEEREAEIQKLKETIQQQIDRGLQLLLKPLIEETLTNLGRIP